VRGANPTGLEVGKKKKDSPGSFRGLIINRSNGVMIGRQLGEKQEVEVNQS